MFLCFYVFMMDLIFFLGRSEYVFGGVMMFCPTNESMGARPICPVGGHPGIRQVDRVDQYGMNKA